MGPFDYQGVTRTEGAKRAKVLPKVLPRPSMSADCCQRLDGEKYANQVDFASVIRHPKISQTVTRKIQFTWRCGGRAQKDFATSPPCLLHSLPTWLLSSLLGVPSLPFSIPTAGLVPNLPTSHAWPPWPRAAGQVYLARCRCLVAIESINAAKDYWRLLITSWPESRLALLDDVTLWGVIHLK